MITFIVTPLAGGFCACMFTHLDILIRGEEEARKPLFGPFWLKMEAKAGIDETEVPKYKLTGTTEKVINVTPEESDADIENNALESDTDIEIIEVPSKVI